MDKIRGRSVDFFFLRIHEDDPRHNIDLYVLQLRDVDVRTHSIGRIRVSVLQTSFRIREHSIYSSRITGSGKVSTCHVDENPNDSQVITQLFTLQLVTVRLRSR